MNANDFRLPPHSIEAEQSLLGGLLLDNRAWERAADLVTEADFYRDDHRRIFRHIARLIDAGRPADVVTVSDALAQAGEADQAGGMAYLGEIANSTPSAANIRRYAEIIREKNQLRALATIAGEIADLAAAPGMLSTAERIERAASLVSALGDTQPSQHEPAPILVGLRQAVDAIQQRYDSGNGVAGLSTGFSDLDAALSGLHPGDLIIVAGRASMGKTAMALSIAEHAALTGQTAAVFSMEMTSPQLAQRALSSIGQIDGGRLRSGQLTEDDFARMTAALSRLHDAPLIIDETPALTLAQVRARCRRIMRKHGLALIVIDYLQLMRGNGDTREQEVAGLSRGLKALAKELHVPVIALSQLSRRVEDRADKRPVMSDLRESGALEQDADVVLLIYRDDYYHRESPFAGIAEVIIGKQRNGPTGTVKLIWQGEYSRFRDADPATIAEAARLAREAKPVRKSRGFE